MNGTSVSNGTRLSPISIFQQSFGNFPESFGKWKTPPGFARFVLFAVRLKLVVVNQQPQMKEERTTNTKTKVCRQ